MTEISDDIDFMKGINDDNSGYSLYLLCKLKSRKLIVLQNLNNNLINISNNIEYNKDLSIVNFGEIVVNDNDNYLLLILEKLLLMIMIMMIIIILKKNILCSFLTLRQKFIIKNLN